MAQSCKCAIALGSNLGNSLTIVNQALEMIYASIEVLAVSRWYRTKPIGYAGGKMVVVPQPDFVNGCILAVTDLPPLSLLHFLLAIERKFGRIRLEPGSARTLDLDLLFYENFVISTPELHLPHPRMTDRGFVLYPLAEIAPHWQHPTQNRSVAELAAQLDHPLCAPLPYAD